MTLAEIIATHPVPWRHIVQLGTIHVIDAANREVLLFTMLDFVQQSTAAMSANKDAGVSAKV